MATVQTASITIQLSMLRKDSDPIFDSSVTNEDKLKYFLGEELLTMLSSNITELVDTIANDPKLLVEVLI